MKKLHSCHLIFTLLVTSLFGIVSCDSDTTAGPQQEESNPVSLKKSHPQPGNPNNPHDEAGRLHTELSEAYYETGDSDSTVSEVVTAVQKLADSSSSFNALTSPDYHPVSVAEVQHLLDHPTTSVAVAISASSMSDAAQLSLLNFVNSYLLLFDHEQSADVLYQTCIAYEDSVLKAPSMTATDKRIVLTTISIARHSTYKARKKPKKNTDPDWTIFVGNIAAGIEGAEYGTAEAVVKALATGIVQNRQAGKRE